MAGESQRPNAFAPLRELFAANARIGTVYPPYEPADRSGHVVDLGPGVEMGPSVPMRWTGMRIDTCVICGSTACRHLRGKDGR